MGRLRDLVLVIVLCFAIVACVSQQAKQIRRMYYDTWSPRVQQAVDEGDIIAGMPRNAVFVVIDIPEILIDKRHHLSAYGTRETWVVYRSPLGWIYAPNELALTVFIHFKNDRVESISVY